MIELVHAWFFAVSKAPVWTPSIRTFVEVLNERDELAPGPFEVAELWSVYDYIRGSKRLKLPPSLKAVLPGSM